MDKKASMQFKQNEFQNDVDKLVEIHWNSNRYKAFIKKKKSLKHFKKMNQELSMQI